MSERPDDKAQAGGRAGAAPRPARGAASTGPAVALGTNLAVGVAAFVLLGYYLDRRYGTGNRYTLGGFVFAMIYGAYEVWKAVRALGGGGPPGAAAGAPGNPPASGVDSAGAEPPAP